MNDLAAPHRTAAPSLRLDPRERTNDLARPRRTHPRRRRFALLATLVALALTVVTPGVVAAADDGGYWLPSSYSAKDEALLVTLTNQARASAGLNALTVDPALTSMARWRSKDMADRNYFSHNIPPDGKTVFDYLTASGYCYKVAGENIGTNTFPDDVATQTIQNGFMGSPGHRANILGTWQVIGIGAWEGADGTHFWTVLFAIKCSAPAPAATPKPTPKPTARPVATPKPLVATPRPTVAPTPLVTPEPTPFVSDPPSFDPTLDPTIDPDATPFTILSTPPPSTSTDHPGRALGLQVIDPPVEHGLVDAIVGDVTAGFFGR